MLSEAQTKIFHGSHTLVCIHVTGFMKNARVNVKWVPLQSQITYTHFVGTTLQRLKITPSPKQENKYRRTQNGGLEGQWWKKGTDWRFFESFIVYFEVVLGYEKRMVDWTRDYFYKKGLTFLWVIFSSTLNMFSAESKTVERARYSFFINPIIYQSSVFQIFIFMEIKIKTFSVILAMMSYSRYSLI